MYCIISRVLHSLSKYLCSGDVAVAVRCNAMHIACTALGSVALADSGTVQYSFCQFVKNVSSTVVEKLPYLLPTFNAKQQR